MCKLITFVFVLFLGTALPKFGFTQTSFGVKAGLNFAGARFDGYQVQSQPAFNAGIASKIAFSEKLYLRPELLYSEKGWKSDEVTMTLHYLNIPVLLGYRPVSAFSVLLGPELGYLLNVVRKPDAPQIPPYEKFDYGAAVGAAYDISEHLTVEARYIHGFDTLLKAEGRDANNQPTGEISRHGANRTIQFSLLYFFSGAD